MRTLLESRKSVASFAFVAENPADSRRNPASDLCFCFACRAQESSYRQSTYQMKTPFPHLIAAIGLSAVFAGSIEGQDALQPEAVRILENAVKFYRDTPIQFTTKSSIVQAMGARKNEMAVSHTIVSSKGVFSMKGSSESRGMPAPTIHYAKGAAIVILGEDGYFEVDGLQSFRQAFESPDLGYDTTTGENSIVSGGPGTGVFQRLLFQLSGKPLGDFASLKLDGETEVDGKKAHKLTGEVNLNPLGLPVEGAVPFEMAIQQGGVPALLSYKPDLAPLVAKMAEKQPQLADLKFTIECTYSDWKTGDAIDRSLLKVPEPGDVKKYASFQEFLKAMQGGGGPSADELVGKGAPDFELDLLNGKKFKLSGEKGKSIVILDFWATWCGPCVRAMPIIDKVAKAYAAKGVKLIAVNLRETEAEVKAFMAQHKLAPTVVMDREGATANNYRVTGIPQTVIVGKDGNVAQVHVGLLPNLEDQLKKELDELLAK
jgi:thiol-disulfide isomerase/thioredoxin